MHVPIRFIRITTLFRMMLKATCGLSHNWLRKFSQKGKSDE